MRRPLNYTTRVPARQTIAECQDLLGQAGAHSVSVLYEDRKPAGLSFELPTPAGVRVFALPVNPDGILKLLKTMDWPPSMRKNGQAAKLMTRDHAITVAWRVAKDWLEAQLAIIDASMVTIDQVMLPYLQVEPGVTVYDRFLENAKAMLEA
jgi:hypothetical protein